MKKLSRREVIAATIATSSLGIGEANAVGRAAKTIASPNGRIVVELDADGSAWSIRSGGQVILERSPLSLALDGGRTLGPGARLISARSRQRRRSWDPPYGIRSIYADEHGELELTLEDRAHGVRFAIVARAYDTGAAIRFRLISSPDAQLTLASETVEFRLPGTATILASRDEGEWQRTTQTRVGPEPHPPLTNSSDRGDLADTPVAALLPDGSALLISEADRLHYPRMMLRSTTQGLVTALMRYPGRATGPSGPGETAPELQFKVALPFETPWRLVIVAPSPAKLIERQDLIPTLSTPNRLGDISWIRPGRAIRITRYTTQAGLATVDFAAKRKLDYVEWDAHWYGDGTDPSDATYAIPTIDIRRVIDYARSKGIGMILYVDRVPAMRQLDAIVKTYRKWGVAGIKFGFIWEGRQSDSDFIYNLVKTCGEHRLLVNLHDNLRPAGLERTLPNYVALEGVRGNEQFPTATHNCILPFTRALTGPIDYTICFANAKNRTTNAHQLAMAAVYYNPLTFLYWYDTPEKYARREWPELAFFDECPTTWDETVGLSGQIGKHVVVARRAGRRWFLGAMTNEQARSLSIDLAFLGKGRWKARRFGDGKPAFRPAETPVVLFTSEVTPSDQLSLDLAPGGGQAIIFEAI